MPSYTALVAALLTAEKTLNKSFMNSARSLRTRALMALLLMVGFYTLSLALAVGLLWIPYGEYVYLDRVDGRLALFCIITALGILWALVPRTDKFEPPGPRLTPGNAPYLFTIIEEIARATSQPRPEEVYLLPDVNAFVTHRGGVMGFRSHRVMGVGLPLIKALSPGELRSVIAHEFGHFVSGDVALGPWIYKTRAAIFRAIEGMSGNILQSAFVAYGKMFMRMTMQVSREQEFVADATAAKVAGVAQATSALKRVEFIAPAYASYFSNEVLPVLRAGYLPIVGDGFDRYLADPDMAKLFQDYAKQAIGAEVGEYDSHPPTAERLAALQRIKEKPRENPKDATAVMLKEPERHIRALIDHMYGKENVSKLKPIKWDEVGAKVYAAMWTGMVEEHATILGTLTADQIPADPKWFKKMGTAVAKLHNRTDVDTGELAEYAKHVLLCAIGAALVKQGWAIETAPGRPLNVVKDGNHFEPHVAVGKLGDGTMNVDEWKAQCASLGIAGVALATAAADTQSKIA
jgi:Zn-dependent protease with chaperone function